MELLNTLISVVHGMPIPSEAPFWVRGSTENVSSEKASLTEYVALHRPGDLRLRHLGSLET